MWYSSEKRNSVYLILRIISILFLLLCIAFFTLLKERHSNIADEGIEKLLITDSTGANHILEIPSIEFVSTYGYPKNVNGETFGPDIKDNVAFEPDLILSENNEGLVGYIRSADVTKNYFCPNDANSSQHEQSIINLYLQDGTTVIGIFMPSPESEVTNET